MAYTQEQTKILKDMRAFLDYCMTFEGHKDALPFEQVLETLLHDAGGILRRDKLLSPRSADYDKNRAVWENYAVERGLEVKH